MIIAIIFIILILFIAFLVIWRFLSNRYVIPCPAWLGFMVETDNPFTKINRAATIIEQLQLKPGMSVLDAGCGPGRLTISIARKVGSQGKVMALDIQKKMLERVKEKARSANLDNITLINAGLGDGKLATNTFDRAILVAVLGEIPNQIKALQEVFNALKRGGMLSITETMFDPHYQRLNNVLTLAQKIGFRKRVLNSDWFSYNLLLEKPDEHSK
jgi:ubiquinone/menaquinone biosynthesis C-methylase UbiE